MSVYYIEEDIEGDDEVSGDDEVYVLEMESESGDEDETFVVWPEMTEQSPSAGNDAQPNPVMLGPRPHTSARIQTRVVQPVTVKEGKRPGTGVTNKLTEERKIKTKVRPVIGANKVIEPYQDQIPTLNIPGPDDEPVAVPVTEATAQVVDQAPPIEAPILHEVVLPMPGLAASHLPGMVTTVLLSESAKPVAVEVKPDSYPCIACDKVYKTKKRFREHYRDVHLYQKYKCDLCDKVFSSPTDLRKHFVIVHDQGNPLKCHLCENKFELQAELSAHLKAIHNCDKPFQCHICEKEYAKSNDRDDHVKSAHIKETNFYCEYCSKGFVLKRALRHHLEGVHSTERLYQCEECPLSFNRSATLYQHVQGVHKKNRRFKCDRCPLSFYRKGGLQRHVDAVHLGIKAYQCSHCQQGFSRPNFLQNHIKKLHGEANQPDTAAATDAPVAAASSSEQVLHFKCRHCDATFQRPIALQKHARRIHGIHEVVNRDGSVVEEEKLFRCRGCEVRFYQHSSLREHLQFCTKKKPTAKKPLEVPEQWLEQVFASLKPLKPTRLGSEVDNDEEEIVSSSDDEKRRQFLCPKCDKVFFQRMSLQVHQETCLGKPKDLDLDESEIETIIENTCSTDGGTDPQKGFRSLMARVTQKNGHQKIICIICSQSFNFVKSFQRHLLLVHKHSNPEQCHLCQAIFPSRKDLEAHLNKDHSNQRPYQCPQCVRTFPRKTHLRVHIRVVHDEVKSFVCQHCGKCFGLRSSLKKHIDSVHENLRPHECSVCSKRFAQAGTLDQHVLTVHQKKRPHACDGCPQTFSRIHGLRRHVMAVHLNMRPYQCTVCNKKFLERDKFRNHLKNQHQMEITQADLEKAAGPVAVAQTS